MSNPIAIYSQDWHLQRYAWAKHPALAGDSFCSLRQIISLCIRHRLPLLAAGDLFDVDRPDPLVVQQAFNAMDDMADKKLPVYFIQGNHEYHDPAWIYLHPWPTHVHEESFRIGKYKAYGLDYQNINNIQNSLSKIPDETEILLCHQVWKEFMNIGIPDASFADVPKATMVLSGDYHKLIYKDCVGKDGQDLIAVSAGNTCMQALDEDPRKYILILKDDLSLTPIQLQTRALYVQELQDPMDWLAWEKHLEEHCPVRIGLHIPKEINKPILHVKYPITLENAYKNVLKIVRDRYHLFWTPLYLLPNQRYPEEKNYLGHKGLEGCLELCCEKDLEVYQVTLRLLRTQGHNVKREIQNMMDEFLDKQEIEINKNKHETTVVRA